MTLPDGRRGRSRNARPVPRRQRSSKGPAGAPRQAATGGGRSPQPGARRARLILLAIVVGAGLLALVAGCVYFQILRASSLTEIARTQHERAVTLLPRRGPILDRNGQELAVSLDVYSVYADPTMVIDPIAAARRLEPLLKMKRSKLHAILAPGEGDKRFAWLKRQIDPGLRRRIEALDLTGIEFVRESRRFYPKQKLAAHVVGACGVDNQGLAGIEFALDEVIRGTPGRIHFLRDGHGDRVLDLSHTEPTPGSGLRLTIDVIIQHMAERELDRVIAESSPKGATVVVLRPGTGEVLALASRPTFDPHRYAKASQEAQRNRAVSDFYEPGSAFKVVTAAAVLDAGKAQPDDVIWCQNGSIVVAKHRFDEDRLPFGDLTFSEVLAKSSNVGAIKLALRLPAEHFLDTIHRFGFGSKSGLELRGESSGLLRTLDEWSGLSQASIAIGQEIGVTPIQLATAFGAVANDGVLVRPHLVGARIEADGRAFSLRTRNDRRGERVISDSTARALRRMLVLVTTEGTGKAAAIPGYSVGGKTGTAQKIDSTRRYSHSKFVSWFAGMVPADHPELVVVVMVDEPQGPRFHGGDVAAPSFARIAGPALRYLGVTPDRDGILVFDRVASASLRAGNRSRDRGGAMRLAVRRGADARSVGAMEASIVGRGARRSAVDSHATASASRTGIQEGGVSMPDLAGMSLRRASEILAAAGITCDTRSSGPRVSSQDPRPGAIVTRGSRCTVIF